MALSPVGSPTEHESATQESMQESMFEELPGFSGAELDDVAYDDSGVDSDEPPYEAAESFPVDALEPASDQPAHELTSANIEALATNEAMEIIVEPGQLDEPAPSVPADPPVAQAPSLVVEAEPEPMTVLTVDDFAALEERVFRAVNLVRSERLARAAAEERASALEAQLREQLPSIERLQHEVDSLRIEREQVRQRVERLLSQLDALEL
jgi:hypothetical protein